MAKIHIEETVKLEKEQLRTKVENLLTKVKEKYGLKGEWKNDLYTFKAPQVDGKILAANGKVTVDISLGLLASAFKDKIECELKQRIKEELSK